MDLIVGLAAVDQMDGGQQMKQLADGWSSRAPRRGGRLRARIGTAPIALGTRLAPSAGRPVGTGHTVAGSVRS